MVHRLPVVFEYFFWEDAYEIALMMGDRGRLHKTHKAVVWKEPSQDRPWKVGWKLRRKP